MYTPFFSLIFCYSISTSKVLFISSLVIYTLIRYTNSHIKKDINNLRKIIKQWCIDRSKNVEKASLLFLILSQVIFDIHIHIYVQQKTRRIEINDINLLGRLTNTPELKKSANKRPHASYPTSVAVQFSKIYLFKCPGYPVAKFSDKS